MVCHIAFMVQCSSPKGTVFLGFNHSQAIALVYGGIAAVLSALMQALKLPDIMKPSAWVKSLPWFGKMCQPLVSSNMTMEHPLSMEDFSSKSLIDKWSIFRCHVWLPEGIYIYIYGKVMVNSLLCSYADIISWHFDCSRCTRLDWECWGVVVDTW